MQYRIRREKDAIKHLNRKWIDVYWAEYWKGRWISFKYTMPFLTQGEAETWLREQKGAKEVLYG